MRRELLAAAVILLFLCVGIPLMYGHYTSGQGTTDAGTQSKASVTPAKNKKLAGLQKIDGKYYYYKNGEAVTDNYRKVNVNGVNYYYYFQNDGSAYTGGYKKVTWQDKTYYCYFKKNGRAFTTGFKKIKINGVNYYFYFDQYGRAVTDKLKKVTTSRGETAYYYFRSNGRAAMNCFKTVDGNKYYFKSNGQACTSGRKKITHYMCYFDENGVLGRKIDLNKKLIALTYDDGPSSYTNTLLDAMEKYGTVCTFFIVGSRVPSYESTVIREAELGCELANHTYEHQVLTSLENDSEIIDQVEKCNDIIEALTGIRPALLRSPGGHRDEHIDSLVGMPNILWSVDSKDWKTKDTNATIQEVKDNASDGAIVLMHDLHESTCNAADSIIKWLLSEDYELVTVSEMADCRGITLEKGSRYFSMK